ncbi:MAG TPA: hypothetical protein VMU93_08835 [Caulobacteraceae bacterium]|nr:hypothetical protein [Caulobacteraceae bacterium]
MTALERRHVWPLAPAAAPRQGAEPGAMAALARMAEAAGVPPTRLLADFATLAIGPGHVTFADYERLRLYDEAFWAGGDRRWVVGARRARQIALLANYRHDWLGLTTNRLAWSAYLGAHGLPVVPVEAIYAPGLATPAAHVLRTRGELRQFLARHAGAALAARPLEGGRARMIAADAGAEADALVQDICDGGAHLFQPLVAPHPATARATGGRLAAVRLLTLGGDGAEPKVVRALWKPLGRAALLAQLDLRSGEVLRLTSGFGPDLVEVRRSRLPLAAMPDWEALKASAVEAARVMRPLGLLGWDIGCGASGPAILGLTATPDLTGHQLADRRGALEPEFAQFLDVQRRRAAEHADLARGEGAWA